MWILSGGDHSPKIIDEQKVSGSTVRVGPEQKSKKKLKKTVMQGIWFQIDDLKAGAYRARCRVSGTIYEKEMGRFLDQCQRESEA